MSDQIDRVTRGTQTLLSVRGEIDLANADQVRCQVEAAVAGSERVVLDLSQTTYLDSQGLRLLSRLSAHLDEQGIEFQVLAPEGSIARTLLDLTAMTDVIQVVSTPSR